MIHRNVHHFAAFSIIAMVLVINQGCGNNSNQERVTVDKAYQANSDLDITQDIRQALVAHDSLSISAQNVKVNVKDGVVRLSGPVKSFEEKAIVANIASTATGKKEIQDEMSVVSN